MIPPIRSEQSYLEELDVLMGLSSESLPVESSSSSSSFEATIPLLPVHPDGVASTLELIDELARCDKIFLKWDTPYLRAKGRILLTLIERSNVSSPYVDEFLALSRALPLDLKREYFFELAVLFFEEQNYPRAFSYFDRSMTANTLKEPEERVKYLKKLHEVLGIYGQVDSRIYNAVNRAVESLKSDLENAEYFTELLVKEIDLGLEKPLRLEEYQSFSPVFTRARKGRQLQDVSLDMGEFFLYNHEWSLACWMLLNAAYSVPPAGIQAGFIQRFMDLMDKIPPEEVYADSIKNLKAIPSNSPALYEVMKGVMCSCFLKWHETGEGFDKAISFSVREKRLVALYNAIELCGSIYILDSDSAELLFVEVSLQFVEKVANLLVNQLFNISLSPRVRVLQYYWITHCCLFAVEARHSFEFSFESGMVDAFKHINIARSIVHEDADLKADILELYNRYWGESAEATESPLAVAASSSSGPFDFSKLRITIP